MLRVPGGPGLTAQQRFVPELFPELLSEVRRERVEKNEERLEVDLGATIGLAAVQINIFISTNYASSQASAVAWLSYAFRLLYLPMGLFGVAVGTVAGARLSRLVGEAVEQIRWARAHGLSVFAETCPQYLFLTAEDLGIDDSYQGARCVCSPPPRDKSNQEVIWNGLADGLFTVFSSDHAPFRYDAPEGKKPDGKEVAFRHIPNGIPGLETRLPLLYSEGVLGGRLTLEKFVELTSTNPAKAYGLHPRKGTIAIGSDADLVIWDERELVLRNEALHHAVDYTPYEGMTLRAWPAFTLIGGEVVWDGTAFHPRAGQGRFLRCGTPTLRPARKDLP